jgi:predicted secreted protein
MLRSLFLAPLFATVSALAAAQTPPVSVAAPRADGTVVLMTGSAEIEVPNDEAVASFYFEAQDADLAKAQSLVNQRVAEAVAQIKRADPKGQVETAGYMSYPVYSREGRKVIAWRVRQTVTLRTAELATLPRTVATAQSVLALGGVDFRLSRAARERVEAELIQRSIANLNARVAAVAQAMNVPPSRLRTEELIFGVQEIARPMPMMARAAPPVAAEQMVEPQFDAGRSLLQMTVNGRVRLLPAQ